ncbi:MAG: hypothetical protein ACRDQU_16350 [Pseudonocardiaceae bacterium]
MDIEYFARWLWSEGRGLEPLTRKQVARLHDKGRTYVVHLVNEQRVLTIRPETGYVALAFLGPSGERLGGIALVLGGTPVIESIDVQQHGTEVVRLQGGHGISLTVTTAPFDEPSEFHPKPLSALTFPALGEYAELAKLPGDPWEYVELPSGFDPPQPRA